MLKIHWKIAAAAAFMTAAGIYYGLTQAGGTGFQDPAGAGGRKMEEILSMEETDVTGGMPAGGMEAGNAENSSENGNNTGNGTGDRTAEETGEYPGADGASEEELQEPEAAGPGIYVHVCGEVQIPGVYELPEGSRAFEAVEAAGGFTEAAAQESVNLAAAVWDGMRLNIPDRAEAENLTPAELERFTGQGMSAGQGIPDGNGAAEERFSLVNINTAGREELMTLNGIGESRADDIIRYRTQNGGFGSIEDIKKVPGIKDAMFQKIKDRITV